MRKKHTKYPVFKRFLLIFATINAIGVGLNFIFYYLNLPNKIEFLKTQADAYFLAGGILIYIIFGTMLYFTIHLHYIISNRE